MGVADLRPKALWRLSTDIEPLGNADTAAPGSFLLAVFLGLKKALKDARADRGWRVPRLLGNVAAARYLTYAATLNQKRSAMHLVQELDGAVFFVRGIDPPAAHEHVVATSRHIRGRSAWLGLVLFLPVVFKLLLSRYDERALSRNSFDATLRAYGDVLFWLEMLRQIRPSAVLVLNDHSADHRALLFAAGNLRIPSVFLPHGPTAEHFPPLTSDFAFLDGTAVAGMYAGKDAGKDGGDKTAFLTGPVRYPSRLSYARSRTEKQGQPKIGVAITLLDPDTRITELLDAFHRETDYDLVLRPHPRTGQARLHALREHASALGYGFSDATSERSEGFLSGLDVLLSGTSGILLEAAIDGVPPVYYDFPDVGYDYYGFEGRGLVERRCTSPQDAIAEVARVRTEGTQGLSHRVKAFCEDLGTSDQGRSPFIAAEILRALIDGHGVPLERWTEVGGYTPLTVYRLKGSTQA